MATVLAWPLCNDLKNTHTHTHKTRTYVCVAVWRCALSFYSTMGEPVNYLNWLFRFSVCCTRASVLVVAVTVSRAVRASLLRTAVSYPIHECASCHTAIYRYYCYGHCYCTPTTPRARACMCVERLTSEHNDDNDSQNNNNTTHQHPFANRTSNKKENIHSSGVTRFIWSLRV